MARRRGSGLVVATIICAGFLIDYDTRRVIVMMAIMLASLVSSIAGFAFSAICGAMLFHLESDPVQVVQLMITCSIANQLAMTWAMRRDISWAGLSPYLAGGILGLVFGIWLLLYADHSLYTHVFGAFLLAYSVYMLVRQPFVWHRQHPGLDLGVGFLGGITGGAAAFPGAFVTIWCGMKGWDKTRQRAVVQPFILIMQLTALAAISLARRPDMTSAGFDPNNLLFVPASLLGTSLGFALYHRLSDQQFTRSVNVLLLVSGLSYLV
jgi:uncharacterized membrane protein YfcA